MILPSQNHAAAMDRMYRFQRHIYDATRRYYLLGRDRLVRDLDIPAGGTVLEVGCGTGRNLVKVAEAYPEARIYGFDISDEMLKSAGRAVMRAADPSRIRLAQGDALQFDPQRTFGLRSFDRVFFSYTLSMIPDWEGALRHAANMLSNGGKLHVADFGQCEELPAVARSALFAWLRQFGVSPRDQLPQTMKHLAAARGCGWSFITSHRGYSWHLQAGGPVQEETASGTSA